MMTVMFLETSLRMGGTEQVVTQLIERFDRKRVRPILCCFYDTGILGAHLMKEGVTVYHGLARHRWDVTLPFRLFRLLRREHVDVLFMINQPLVQFWGTWCGLLARIPVRIAAIRSTGKINRIQRRLLINWLTFPWVSRVTALSQTHKTYLIEKERIDPKKIEIISNGVDLGRFNGVEAPPSLRASLGLPDGAPLVAIVAMLRPEKAHDVFLRAAQTVLKQVPETHFLVAGEGSERLRLERLVAQLGIAPHVHFLGTRRDIPLLLSVCDVGVLSSHSVVETVSNAVLEYMGAQKPVVATRVGSLPEMIDDGETGFLVEPGDWNEMAEKITVLLRDRALASRMGRAGRDKVKRYYTVEQMVSQTEDLFERLLNRGLGVSACES